LLPKQDLRVPIGSIMIRGGGNSSGPRWFSNKHRMACEQTLNDRGKDLSGIRASPLVRIPWGLLPNLFFPWNTCNHHGEHPFQRLVHTMKKMIL
jgi:hypothetical protein